MVTLQAHPQIAIVRLNFGKDIKRVIARANASYRDIMLASKLRDEEVHISTASISRVTTGKLLPSWPWLEQLLKILNVPKGKREEEWLPKLDKAVTLIAALELSAQTMALLADSAPNGMTCPVCYAWTIEPEGHQAYHDEQKRATGRPALRLLHGGAHEPDDR